MIVAKIEPRGTLVGCNAAVNSVDFDSTGSMIIATSNDFSSCVWTMADRRSKVSNFSKTPWEHMFIKGDFF